MSAYAIWDNVEVTEPSRLEEYKTRVAPIVEKFGGRYVVLGGRFEVVEGEWPLTYPVIIEFPNFDTAMRWYHSEEYAVLKALRRSASRGNAVFIEGLTD